MFYNILYFSFLNNNLRRIELQAVDSLNKTIVPKIYCHKTLLYCYLSRIFIFWNYSTQENKIIQIKAIIFPSMVWKGGQMPLPIGGYVGTLMMGCMNKPHGKKTSDKICLISKNT